MKEKIKDDFITELEAMLPKEKVAIARIEAEQEIFNIRLSQLRKQMDVMQKSI